MTTLERIILGRAERQLIPFRIKAAIAREEHAALYAKYVPQIETCYGRVMYWHGTGRYHYEHADGNRYVNKVEKIMDVLNSVVQAGGLKPHFDPWIPVEGRCRESVSLATARMHSRVFARLHLYKDDSLLYELGDAQYWVPLFLSLLFAWLSEKPVQGGIEFVHILRRTPLIHSFQTWASSIRKPKKGSVISLHDIVQGKNIWSDIPGNYPILFGISGKNIRAHQVAPFLRKAEVRVLETVTLESMTHIEVPLAKVEETEIFLREKNVHLPVMPLELCDIFCSTQPLQQLIYV